MLGKNAANPLRICEYFNETEPRSAPSKSGSDTHALLMPEGYKDIEIMMDMENDRVITLGELTPEWWIG